MNVELIYDADCPNVPSTRLVLMEAFARAGLSPVWVEWERGDQANPGYVLRSGSPSILVNGRDVCGAPPGQVAASCRVYVDENGVIRTSPSVGTVEAALLASQSLESAKGEKS